MSHRNHWISALAAALFVGGAPAQSVFPTGLTDRLWQEDDWSPPAECQRHVNPIADDHLHAAAQPIVTGEAVQFVPHNFRSRT